MQSINLNLPRGWNALNAQQLEDIARILIDESRSYTATGRFNRVSLLTRAFFALSGLRIISLAHTDVTEVEFSDGSSESHMHTYYNCEFIDDRERTAHQTVDGIVVPIRIYLDEIMSLSIGDYTEKDIDQYLKSLDRHYKRIDAGKDDPEPSIPEPKSPLGWLLSPCTRTLVPYSQLTLPDPKATKPNNHKNSQPYNLITLQGPSELMDGMSWRQYRIASDYMQYIAQCENTLVRLQQQAIKQNKVSKSLQKQIDDAAQQVKEMRAQFMATLFNRPIPHIDPDTGLKVTSPWYTSSQSQDNAYLFIDLPEEKFQVVSFWWQGMMLHLQRQFPLVFRKEKIKGDGKDADPLALYTRSTATMIKYTAANEEDVNRTSYTVILQHINDMAEENKRIEEMKK